MASIKAQIHERQQTTKIRLLWKQGKAQPNMLADGSQMEWWLWVYDGTKGRCHPACTLPGAQARDRGWRVGSSAEPVASCPRPRGLGCTWASWWPAPSPGRHIRPCLISSQWRWQRTIFFVFILFSSVTRLLLQGFCPCFVCVCNPVMWSDVQGSFHPVCLSHPISKMGVMPTVWCHKWSLSLNVLPEATPRSPGQVTFPHVPYLPAWFC